MTAVRTIDAFADAGVLARQQGVLDQALAELAVRLDIAGAGDLLVTLTASCFGRHDHGVCPTCGHTLKQDPGNPHTPPPPPPPPPPTGTK